jgi:hypothetical protein
LTLLVHADFFSAPSQGFDLSHALDAALMARSSVDGNFRGRYDAALLSP